MDVPPIQAGIILCPIQGYFPSPQALGYPVGRAHPFSVIPAGAVPICLKALKYSLREQGSVWPSAQAALQGEGTPAFCTPCSIKSLII